MSYTITPEEQNYLDLAAAHAANVTDDTQIARDNALREVPIVIGMKVECSADSLNRGGIYCGQWQGRAAGNQAVGAVVYSAMDAWAGAHPCNLKIEVTESNAGPHPQGGYSWAGKVIGIKHDYRDVTRLVEGADGETIAS